jgi:hypothetical protein
LCRFGSLYKDLCNLDTGFDDNQVNRALRCSAMTGAVVAGSFVILQVTTPHRQFYGHCLNKPVILPTVVLFRMDHLDNHWLKICELRVVLLWNQLLGPHMMKSCTYMYLACSRTICVYHTWLAREWSISLQHPWQDKHTKGVLANKMGLEVWWQNIQWISFWTCRRGNNRGRSWTLGHMDLRVLGHISFNSVVRERRRW